jgi:hypothetical protein
LHDVKERFTIIHFTIQKIRRQSMAALPENALPAGVGDPDPQETQEWQDALSGVIDQEGAERAHFLIDGLIAQARQEGIDIPYSATTEYVNTIPVERQPKYPGNADMEIRIHNYIRWNAMAMVVRANRRATSAATSLRSPRRQRSTTSASRGSGTRPPSSMAAT